MKIIDRYIVIGVLKASLFMLLALMALHLVFTFSGESNNMKGDYGALQALTYVALLVPRDIMLLLPISALLGVLLSVGALATNNELTVLRSAGMRPARIAIAVFLAGILITAAGLIIQNLVAPSLTERAHNIRATALAGGVAQVDGQIWLRHQALFLYVGSAPSMTRLLDLEMYALDADSGKLNYVGQAKQAEYRDKEWHLSDYAASYWDGQKMQQINHANTTGLQGLNPEEFKLFTLKADSLNLYDLYRYANYLDSNGIESDQYQLAFWRGIATPVAILVMVLLPLPFLFGSMRSMGLGQRVVLGIAAGLVFYVANEMLSNSGLILGFNPMLAAWLPTVVFALIAMITIRRIK